MSEDESAAAGVDLAGSLDRLRGELSGLDHAIAELREEADQLTHRAATRSTLKAMAPPADPGALDDAIAAFGRHAANVVDEFDPTPFDPAEDDHRAEALDEPGRDDVAEVADEVAEVAEAASAPAAGAFDAFAAAAPGEAAPGDDDDGRLPPVDLDQGPGWRVDRPEPTPVLGDDAAGATVLKFAPRPQAPTGEPAFGELPDGQVDAEPTDAATDDAAEEAMGSDAGNGTEAGEAGEPDDGLDAIASSESTEVPTDWDRRDDDGEAAFDRFFHADVEPEPAQRWLLND